MNFDISNLFIIIKNINKMSKQNHSLIKTIKKKNEKLKKDIAKSEAKK